MSLRSALIWTITMICSLDASGQTFNNSDLNGGVGFVSVPTNWTQIPDTDPICQANTPTEATVDILDAAGPNQLGGVAGIPQSGTTFCSGLHASDNGAFLWHEGIMQTVNGFTPGNNYAISFYQAVVKQQNCIDPSGSWQVYLDGNLITTTAASNSALTFDDVNINWDCRIVTFTATAVSHTIKFIPMDDDGNLTNSPADPMGGLRMGIDLIEFVTPADPSINQAGPFCLNEPALNLTAADLGGTWSGNGITNATNGTFDPSVAGIGNHDIIYEIPVGCGFVSDTVTISVVTGTDAGWNSPGQLCPTSPAVNLDALITGVAGGIWSGSGVTGNSFDPSSGTSAVTYSVGTPPCNSDSTITIIVDPQDGASFDYPQSSYCVLDPNPTANITGQAGGTFAIDNGGTINPTTGEVDIAASGLGTFTVTYTTGGPCVSSETFVLTITNTSDATITPVNPICETGGTVTMTAATSGGAWSATCGACINNATGDFDPSVAGIGQHIITYTITGACGSSDNVIVDVVSSGDATITPAGPFCNGNPSVTLSAVDGGGTWSGTGITDPVTGEFNPSVAGTGTHTITYTISGPCGDQDDIQIMVNAPLDVTAFVNQTICSGATANISALASGGDGNYTFTWIDDAGNNVGTGQSIVVTPVTTTVYTVILTDQCGSNSVTDDVTITIEPTPVLSLTVDVTSGCSPLVVNFNESSVPSSSSCFWTFGDTYSSSFCGNVSHTYTEEGCYDVTLSVTTANGCNADTTLTSLICVSPVAQAEFACEGNPTVFDAGVQFVNQSTDADSYFWNFGDGTGDIVSDPYHVFEQGAGTYEVCLTAMNTDNCNSTTCKTIEIEEEFTLYVPNAFTPDGEGINDLFLPVIMGYDPNNFEITIWNRWGELIFESKDPNIGWDGSDRSGIAVKQDVYVWKIKVRELGSIADDLYYGHVTVLR